MRPDTLVSETKLADVATYDVAVNGMAVVSAEPKRYLEGLRGVKRGRLGGQGLGVGQGLIDGVLHLPLAEGQGHRLQLHLMAHRQTQLGLTSSCPSCILHMHNQPVIPSDRQHACGAVAKPTVGGAD